MKPKLPAISFRGDRQIWVIYFLLCVFSVLAAMSAVSNLAYRFTKGYTEPYIIKHVGQLIFGFIIIYVLHNINFNHLRKPLRIMLWLMLPLLIYTGISGTEVGNASRWISVIGFSVQASDIARIVLISNLAMMLANKQHIQNDEYKLWMLNNIIIWIVLICGILVYTSFSTSVMLVITSYMMMVAGRVKANHLTRMLVFSFVGIGLVMLLSIFLERNGLSFGRSETVVDRIELFVDTDLDKKDGIGGKIGKGSNQQLYSLVAVANGGITGQGPGNSFQKYKLPQAYNDYIYGIIVEEYGLIGGILILCFYLWLLYRGVYNIDNTSRPFGGLLCVGLTLSIVFQALMHMMVAVGLMPVTGQTLPLISLGGSSIIMTSVAIGMVLSVTNFDRETPTFVQRRRFAA